MSYSRLPGGGGTGQRSATVFSAVNDCVWNPATEKLIVDRPHVSCTPAAIWLAVLAFATSRK